MTDSLRNVIDEASSHIPAKAAAAPDLSEVKARIHDILIAAGKPGIKDHVLVDMKQRNETLEVRTEWGSRGFVHDEEIEIPLTVIDAEDPLAEAKLWGIRDRIADAAGRAKTHRRELAEAEDDLHDARMELYEASGLIDETIPTSLGGEPPDWKGLIDVLAEVRDKSKNNATSGSADERQAWEGIATIASGGIRHAMQVRDHGSNVGASANPVAIVGAGWDLLWASASPMSDIVEAHSLKIGDKLYTSNTLREVITEISDAASGRPSVGEAKTKDALHGVALLQSSMLAKVMRLCGEYLRSAR
jgi:hypothetical protein